MQNRSNVIALDDHLPSDANIALRQGVVRGAIGEVVNEEPSSPVAYAGVVVCPDGEVSAHACMIEPEHIPIVVEELAGLIARLQSFSRRAGVGAQRGGPALKIDKSAR